MVSMAFNKILLLLFSVHFLNFAISEAQDDPFYLRQDCSSEKTNPNTSFQNEVETLLSYLSSNATTETQFYNTTINDENLSDSIYGLFMCRGDVSSKVCRKCVENATLKLSSECSVSKEATIWYEECMVRYSAYPFFGRKSSEPSFSMQNSGNVSNAKSLARMLSSTMNQTSDEAAFSTNLIKKFATREANFSGFETIYCLAQCTPDLSPNDCRTCLGELIEKIPKCCEGRLGARVLSPSCNIRYEFYPFYSTPSQIPTPNLVPATKASQKDTIFSDDFYLFHNCSMNKTFIQNSTFQTHLNTLLSYLSSNATIGKKLFYKVDINEMVYGLFMCRGDLSSEICGKCVLTVTNRISSECEMSQEGITWNNHCMIRYSYNNFFSKADKRIMFSELNVTNNKKELNFFTVILAKTLDKAAIQAGDSNEKFGTKSSKMNDLQSVYTLAQCTQDLSIKDCKGCLGEIIGTSIPWSRLGSVGGRVVYPSCNLRFELFQFYNASTASDSPQTPSENGKSRSRSIVLIVVITFISVMIFSLGYYLLKRKARRSFKTMLKENFGHDGVNLEPLQFDVAVIQAATNKFSKENYIGKGGFGEVYKGILLDGQEIAVKRLSKSSSQGASEFKNEVLLIAKLQHRNLVAFIGFCLEEEEKILIYEYVPNKSLDYFLFDSKRQKLLSWIERYSIIKGIAQGILYLHEHSRLKVIHRDLKPSNILLDEDMIPKISDFGLARIVEKNQDQGSTNKIVGTLGYMSPEYAMLGQFSQKSDVFSFGIMVLEIITGTKNVNSYGSQFTGDSLPNYVWRHLRNGTQFNIVDPNIQGKYSKTEVNQCIQIGLLCVQHNPEDRPTILTVVSYLDNNLNEIPTPQEPTFFGHAEMDSIAIAEQTSSSQSINFSMPFSMNKMPTSEYPPR